VAPVVVTETEAVSILEPLLVDLVAPVAEMPSDDVAGDEGLVRRLSPDVLGRGRGSRRVRRRADR
jgi:hypothetical protein